MLLIGFDAAVDSKNFGIAVANWSPGETAITDVEAGTRQAGQPSLEHIAARLKSSPRALVAIDAPLGWPSRLADALRAHAAGEALDGEANQIFRRTTDAAVYKLVRKQTLDVGADRIARTALAALSALSELRKQSACAVPLAWAPDYSEHAAVIEVYPAGTLKARGLTCTGYKRHNGVAVRQTIADALADELPQLRAFAGGNDNAFDACLCLLAAKDFLCGRAVAPTPAELAVASREGWIWVRRPERERIA